ncbi:MAG: hypothetical protein J6J42_07965 [Lachnospiraceae bacterium]|nr:hypothetical protein [Lachnospiraceae bacterium]
MKKWICTIISVMMLFSMAACSGTQEEQNDTNSANGTEAEVSHPVEETQPTAQPTKAPTPTPTEIPRSSVWNDKDFEAYGIFDIEPFDLGEFEYDYTERSGIHVYWTEDFIKDYATAMECAKELFDITLEVSGKNAYIVVDDTGSWVLGEPFTCIDDADDGWESDDKTEYGYTADWYYEYNGWLIYVFFISTNEAGEAKTGYSINAFIPVN